jgi:hypothetical protein
LEHREEAIPPTTTHACSCGNIGYADFESALGQRPPVRALGVIVSDDANDEELRLLLQQRYFESTTFYN